MIDRLPVDPPINPGTVQACAAELFRQGPLLDCCSSLIVGRRVTVHAPGVIERVSKSRAAAADGEAGCLTFTVSCWPRRPHGVLVTGLDTEPEVTF